MLETLDSLDSPRSFPQAKDLLALSVREQLSLPAGELPVCDIRCADLATLDPEFLASSASDASLTSRHHCFAGRICLALLARKIVVYIISGLLRFRPRASSSTFAAAGVHAEAYTPRFRFHGLIWQLCLCLDMEHVANKGACCSCDVRPCLSVSRKRVPAKLNLSCHIRRLA